LFLFFWVFFLCYSKIFGEEIFKNNINDNQNIIDGILGVGEE
jgi:hypothetical protein